MINTYIPCGEIPRTPQAGVVQRQWFGADNEHNYRAQGNRAFSHDDVSYEFNTHGYRCDELVDRRELNVLSIGCSITFGLGLNRADTYCQIFCDRLSATLGKSVTNWNLAWTGKSNDYIARMLPTAMPVLKPDVVLVTFTATGRRELFDLDGRCIDYFPAIWRGSEKSRSSEVDRVVRQVRKHLDGLASPLNDLMNFYRNFKLVEFLLNLYRVDWVYSVVVPGQVETLLHQMPADNRVWPPIERIDLARDGGHPGQEANRQFADRVFSTFERRYLAEN